MSARPLDARVAHWLVRPLRHTPVTPSHLTTLRLVVGLASALAFAAGGHWVVTGGWLFFLSNLLDHTDGELARMTGRITPFGHAYDLASDAAVHGLVFLGIGIGLRSGWLHQWAAPLGLLAGLSVSAIFWLRIEIERRIGAARAALPNTGWFEIEDVLYLLPLVVLGGALQPFLLAAVVGAPLFAAWLAVRYRGLRPQPTSPSPPTTPSDLTPGRDP